MNGSPQDDAAAVDLVAAAVAALRQRGGVSRPHPGPEALERAGRVRRVSPRRSPAARGPRFGSLDAPQQGARTGAASASGWEPAHSGAAQNGRAQDADAHSGAAQQASAPLGERGREGDATRELLRRVYRQGVAMAADGTIVRRTGFDGRADRSYRRPVGWAAPMQATFEKMGVGRTFAAASVMARWAEIVSDPALAKGTEPERYDAETRTLVVRANTYAHAQTLRLFTDIIVTHIADTVGEGIVENLTVTVRDRTPKVSSREWVKRRGSRDTYN